jgi:hypothetical protein
MAKALVLCQRRKGVGDELDGINERIHQLVQTLVGDADIKYVSTKGELPGEVDMEFNFDNNEETSALETDYSLIICNTCPFTGMKYNIIHDHLGKGGYLALTVYNQQSTMPAEEFERTGSYKIAVSNILRAGFRKVGHVQDAIVFQKVYDSARDAFRASAMSPDKAEKDALRAEFMASMMEFMSRRKGGTRKRKTRSKKYKHMLWRI